LLENGALASLACPRVLVRIHRTTGRPITCTHTLAGGQTSCVCAVLVAGAALN